MIDKCNPYGIEKDYKCKTCYHECYTKDISFFYMAKDGFILFEKPIKEQHHFQMKFEPICPKCGDMNMKTIIHSYQYGTWEDLQEGKTIGGGFSYQSLFVYLYQYFNIN